MQLPFCSSKSAEEVKGPWEREDKLGRSTYENYGLNIDSNCSCAHINSRWFIINTCYSHRKVLCQPIFDNIIFFKLSYNCITVAGRNSQSDPIFLRRSSVDLWYSVVINNNLVPWPKYGTVIRNFVLSLLPQYRQNRVKVLQ